jgi:hypothetical protein
MNVYELTLAVLTSPRTRTGTQDEAHEGCCDEFARGLGHRLPVNFELLDHCLHMM